MIEGFIIKDLCYKDTLVHHERHQLVAIVSLASLMIDYELRYHYELSVCCPLSVTSSSVFCNVIYSIINVG